MASSYCNRFLNDVKRFFDAFTLIKTNWVESGFAFVGAALRRQGVHENAVAP
jgi:hypothetical protein